MKQGVGIQVNYQYVILKLSLINASYFKNKKLGVKRILAI